MSNHTPEPWRVVEEHGALVVRGTAAVADSDYVAGFRFLADARRCRAAINALQGIPTDFLERLPPGALADAVEQILERL